MEEVGEEANCLLGADHAELDVADKPRAHHHLRVERFRDGFNEVLVSCMWKLEHNLDCNIPRAVESLQIPTVQIIQVASIEAATVDIVQLDEKIGTAEIEILIQRMNLANELSPLGSYILLHAVVVLKDVTKMFEFLHPWKWSTIQEDWSNLESITNIL